MWCGCGMSVMWWVLCEGDHTVCCTVVQGIYKLYMCTYMCTQHYNTTTSPSLFLLYTPLPPYTYLPSPLSCSSRGDQLEKLRSGKVYDVLVIGGGATGCGIALDSVLRGVCILQTVHGLSPSPSPSPTTSPFPSLSLRPSFPPSSSSLPPSIHLFFNPCVKSTSKQYSGAWNWHSCSLKGNIWTSKSPHPARNYNLSTPTQPPKLLWCSTLPPF